MENLQFKGRNTGYYLIAMQEQVTFNFKTINTSTAINHDFVNALIRQNQKAVEALLTSYHFKSRGRVFGLAINPESVQMLSQSMAKFIVHYSIGQFNACADVDYSERAAMEVLLDFDLQAGQGILTGEYIPEREPDEF